MRGPIRWAYGGRKPRERNAVRAARAPIDCSEERSDTGPPRKNENDRLTHLTDPVMDGTVN